MSGAPRRIELVDTTVRDGHQSLWSANALTTPMIAAIAPTIDRVGFRAIDFTSSTQMAMAVRWHAEDPWQRIRAIRELMPETPLGFITPGMRFMSWERAPLEVMQLALRCVIRNGIRRVWIDDPMNDVVAALRIAELAKQEGANEVLVGLVFSISPVHTDDYYAERARAVAASPHVDVLDLKDPGGLLTPERVRTLVPVLRASAPSVPLEVHTHNTATMGGPSYLEAAELGASILCTAVAPLANGTSQPSAEQTIANLRASGFSVDVDDEALAATSAYFVELAARIGRPVGVPREYDARIYVHQLPGGMTSTLRRHLEEIGMAGRWDEVLAELPRVRAELGYPIMVTPLSQYVGVQAFLNVTIGERYAQIPDEVARFVLGRYGEPAGEIDPDVRAKVLASPKAAELAAEEHRLDLAEARARYGDAISDELLLLRMMLPAPQVEAMLAGGGVVARAEPAEQPLRTLVAGLACRPQLREVAIDAPGLRLHARSTRA